MDLHSLLFWAIAFWTGGCAVAVVVTQNIVRAAAWLLFSLAGTAGVFFLLGADFVASTQLIVYVGGVLVLVVFGVMLTAQGPFITMKTGAAEWAVAPVVGLLLYAVLVLSTVTVTWSGFPGQGQWPPYSPDMRNPTNSMNSLVLGESLLGIRQVNSASDLTGVPLAGKGIARTPMAYLLPFEIVSVHLLVVLIGAAYLARAKRRRGAVT